MISVDSKLWSVRAYNDAYSTIVQRASNVSRTISRGALPEHEALAAMHEKRFDAICRDLFHGEVKTRKGLC